MQKRTLIKNGNFYKGNLHIHTNRSDGCCSAEEAADCYAKEGYNFIAITDHWVYGVYEHLNRKDFLVFPGTELDLELPERKDHHLVAIGLPQHNKLPDGYGFQTEQAANQLSTVERMIEYIGQKGNTAIYAHPYWSKVDTNEIKNLHGLLGIEIYNHGAEFESGNGNAEVYFDHFLYVRNRVHAFAADDSHDLSPQSRGGYIMVKSDIFTHAGILAAIQQGSFYATSGPILYDFYVENNAAFISCNQCTDIYFKSPHRSEHYYNSESLLTAAKFDLTGEEEYIRAVIKDSRGQKAWTQPIWLW